MQGLGLGLTLRRGGGAPVVSADLTALKAATATIAVYDPSDVLTMWQDRAGTATQAAVGQPLGYMQNVKTGATSLHMVAPSDARRPILAATGPSFDGTDDALSDAATLGLLSANTTIIALVKTSDTTGVLCTRDDNITYLPAWDGTAGALSVGAGGSVTVKIDGVTKATRVALQSALTDNVTHTVLIELAVMSAWSSFGFSNYTTGGYQVAGTIVPVAVLNGAAGDYAAALVSAQAWALELKTRLGL